MARLCVLTTLSLIVLSVATPVLCDTAADDFETSFRAAVDFINNNATLKAGMKDHLKLFGDDYHQMQKGMLQSAQCPKCPPKYKWPCTVEKSSGPKPTSVHKLQPSDIDVVAAVGDSITAANGLDALTIVGCLLNYRGKSWSIGGVEDISTQFTLPNILKQYNPNLKGFSTGLGNYKSKNAHLNLAVAGSEAGDMLTQAMRLVERMRTTTDFENDWKVVTLFIGGNDLCRSCKAPTSYQTKYYQLHVQNALDFLHANLPRALVNVVPMLEPTQLGQMNIGLCAIVHMFVCKCAAYPKDAKAKEDVITLAFDYQRSLKALIGSGRYDTKEDFTVVYQPFFEHTTLPLKQDSSPDLSYFAPDCFHFSRKGHRNAAEGLWNNMVEPVGKKRTDWTPDEQVLCPSEDHPYFFTNKNSNAPSVGQVINQQLDARQPSSNVLDSVSSSSGVIVGSVCGVLAVLAFVGVLLFARQKRRAVNPGEKQSLYNGENNAAYS